MWKLQPDDRLDHWKNFRRRIGTLSVEQALIECESFWQKAPFAPFYLDYHDTTNWPDPWQLIYENWYCDLAKALGIVYTLHLCEHGEAMELEIKVFQDPISRGQYNLVYIDKGKYVLNFVPGEVVNKTQIPTEFKCLTGLDSQALKLYAY